MGNADNAMSRSMGIMVANLKSPSMSPFIIPLLISIWRGIPDVLLMIEMSPNDRASPPAEAKFNPLMLM